MMIWVPVYQVACVLSLYGVYVRCMVFIYQRRGGLAMCAIHVLLYACVCFVC